MNNNFCSRVVHEYNIILVVDIFVNININFFTYYCYLRKTHGIIIIMAHVWHGQSMKKQHVVVTANIKIASKNNEKPQAFKWA